ATSCHPLSRRSCVESRSITITDEFRTASGYGSVWVVLLLGGDDACTHLMIRFCFRHSLNSAQRKEHLWLASREKAHGRESNSTNALTCCTDIKNPETVMQALTITCELFRDCILQTSQPAMVGVPDDTSK
ncbi:TPA: hypothetical protein ACIYG4_003601, partial [Escherichia coli]